MKTADELSAIADRLAVIRRQLADLADEAGELVSGLGPIRERARAGWLRSLDRATGSERMTTIDDTIEEVRTEAGVAARASIS